jgi:hypothetical protein
LLLFFSLKTLLTSTEATCPRVKINVHNGRDLAGARQGVNVTVTAGHAPDIAAITQKLTRDRM